MLLLGRGFFFVFLSLPLDILLRILPTLILPAYRFTMLTARVFVNSRHSTSSETLCVRKIFFVNRIVKWSEAFVNRGLTVYKLTADGVKFCVQPVAVANVFRDPAYTAKKRRRMTSAKEASATRREVVFYVSDIGSRRMSWEASSTPVKATRQDRKTLHSGAPRERVCFHLCTLPAINLLIYAEDGNGCKTLFPVKWNTNLMQHCAGFISAGSIYMFRAQAPIIRSI